jgi:hypothetical protein
MRAKVSWDEDVELLASQSLGASSSKSVSAATLAALFGKMYTAIRLQLKIVFGAAAAGNVSVNVYPSCDKGTTFDKTAAYTKTVTGASGATRAESVIIMDIPYGNIEVVNADAANAHTIQLKAAARSWES